MSDTEITARDVEHHFNALTGRDGWDARSDWALVQALCRGKGLIFAASVCGRRVAACRERWEALMPEPGNLNLQEMVVREARRRVELEGEP